ncbi:hypothetical protein Sste5346_006334 [Sporothrix stenoceras]|uniref:Xylanolytic transcriptional activator regulatory domain-containing protein n=1 Tax=Sporothrix stenoceras TaxID=5173 RepID=A0ABR3YYR3_9PEZI
MRKNKPGLKAGAIESLGKRIDALEKALCERQPPPGALANGDGTTNTTNDGPVSENAPSNLPRNTQADVLTPLHGSLATVAQVLSKLNDNITVLSQSISASPRSASHDDPNDPNDSRPAKRTRLDDGHRHSHSTLHISSHTQEANGNSTSTTDIESEILHGERLDALLDAYFLKLHPWIPMMHQATFRRRVHETQLSQGGDIVRDRLSVVLDAMVVGALHLVDAGKLPSFLSGDPGQIQATIEKARRRVLVEATSELTVENLQALVIVAFSDLGNGEPSRAWPIIGSLTRTVEFLCLNVENDQHHDSPASYFSLPSLPPPRNWIEEEERRRVFWNIFALDRTCSITTGWSVGLTADNVSRRLPICGTHWNDEIRAEAPFFEIWDMAAAKISNSIAFLPANYSSPGRANENGNKGPGSAGGNNGTCPDNHSHSANTEYAPTRPRRQQKASGPIDKSAVGAFAYYVESLEWLSRIFTYFLQPKVNFKNPEEVSNWLTRFKELDLDLVHWKMFLPPKWKDPSIPPPETANFLDPNMSLAHVTHNTSMILLHQCIGYPDTKKHALHRLQLRLPSDYSAQTCQGAAIETAHITREYLASAPAAKSVSPHFAFCAFVSAKVLLGQLGQSPYYVQVNNVPGSANAIISGMTINSAQNSAQSVDSASWMLQANGHDGLSNILDSLTDSSFMDLDRIISFDETFSSVPTVPGDNMVQMQQTEGHDWTRPGYN